MADSVASGGRNAGSSSLSSQDKGSKDKRKLADPSQKNPVNLPLSLTEFPRYEPSLEKFRNPTSRLPSMDVGSGESKEAVGEEYESSEWDDPIVRALEELLSYGLHALFRNAIKKIVECGYSEDVAFKSIVRHGFYCEGKDLVSNIVTDTLSVLKKGKGTDCSMDEVFEDLQQMVDYTILEMINVFREVKPSLSIAESMWWLLMCDLNIFQACSAEGDLLSFFDNKQVLGESSYESTPSQPRSRDRSTETIPSNTSESNIPKPSTPKAQSYLPETIKFGSFPNLPNPINTVAPEESLPERDSLVSAVESVEKSLSSLGKRVQTMSLGSGEGSGAGRKGWSKKELVTLQQKSCHGHTEKTYRTYGKGAFKSGKLASIGGFVVERRAKPPTDFSAVHPKGGFSKSITERGAATFSADGGHCASTSAPLARSLSDSPSTLPTKVTVCALPATNTELEVSSSSKKNPVEVEATAFVSPMTPDYYAGIPFEESLGKYDPQNEKDELILKLVPRLHELQNELKSWTEWANQKVMQAAHRLSKNQTELKALRQEKQEAEQRKKEKQILEENTMKRLSEMEFALNNATGQVDKSNSTVRKLEVEHFLLKKEMEASKLQAVESAASCQEALEREQKALKNAHAWEGQKVLLQEELVVEKQKAAELQQEISKAQNRYNQAEARLREERMAKEKYLAQAGVLRKQREQLEAAAKAEEETIKLEAEKEMKKYMEEIKELESQLSLLKFKSDSSKIAALRGSVDGGFGDFLPDSMVENPPMKGNPIPSFSRGGTSSPSISGMGGLKREWECVMCLSEEKSVVFLSCAHQVLCPKCNELHEKQGMNDCPSCRTPIQRRIQVRFALP